MSEEKLDQYPLAMAIDPDTGKPMSKVLAVGTGGSGGDVVVDFPSDFPDASLLDAITELNSKIDALISKIDSQNQVNNDILDTLGLMLDGPLSVKIVQDNIEGEE